MPRKQGSRNLGFDERRSALLARLRERLARRGAMRPTLRDLAEASGVGLSTLNHYFGRRDDVVAAVMAEDGARSAAHLEALATPAGDFAASVDAAARYAVEGFRYGVDAVFAIGLVEGLRHPALGPHFIDQALEPSIDALRRRLDAHVAAGEMRPCDTRVAALGLLAPIILAFLHQHDLGGKSAHPLDLDHLVAEHAGAFVRAYRA